MCVVNVFNASVKYPTGRPERSRRVPTRAIALSKWATQILDEHPGRSRVASGGQLGRELQSRVRQSVALHPTPLAAARVRLGRLRNDSTSTCSCPGALDRRTVASVTGGRVRGRSRNARKGRPSGDAPRNDDCSASFGKRGRRKREEGGSLGSGREVGARPGSKWRRLVSGRRRELPRSRPVAADLVLFWANGRHNGGPQPGRVCDGEFA
jgi:hypothetical protein